jgi:glutamate/aspartate transport system substrate-binding protein
MKPQFSKMAVCVLAATLLSACGDKPADKSAPAASNASEAVSAVKADTLNKIKTSGEIALGHRESSIPFSYLATAATPIGYSHDVQLKIVEAVKKELNLPNLKVKYVQVTSANRISLIQNGTVDLECGSTTNNVERQQQVSFTNGIFDVATRLLVKKGSGIKDFADLKGKNVVSTSGTTSERLFKAMNEKDAMNMNVISAKDHAESFLMLETGRATAFMMDDALLYGEKAKAKKADDWEVVGTPQSHEIYGCMLAKDDVAFKKVADAAIVDLYKSGEINAIYTKWFMNPIPPKNFNLNFPMSDSMKALIANPTDKAAGQ